MSGITDRRRVMSKTILYETLTVTVSGLSSGFTIYVINATTGATIDATNSTSSTYEIEEGTRYYVSASSVSGYDKPASSSTYTAVGNNSRTIRMTYSVSHSGTKSPTEGIVYVQDTDGYLHTYDEWNNTGKYEYTPNGIAYYKNEYVRFVMAYNIPASDLAYTDWAPSGYYLYASDTIDYWNDGGSSYDMKYNTSHILNVLGSEAGIASYCRSYRFPDGSIGHLGAVGQWGCVLDNLTEFRNMVTLLGGSEYLLSTFFHNYVCTSTWKGEDTNDIYVANLSKKKTELVYMSSYSRSIPIPFKVL